MRKLLPSSLVLLAAVGSAWADWNVEFDFNSGIPQEVFVSNLIEGGTAVADTLDGWMRLQHGDPLEDTNNLWVMLPLSEDLKAASIAANGPVTVYFEMMHPSVSGTPAIVDVAWGLSNEDPDTVLETRYNVFNAMMRINAGTSGFELRDGGSYVPVTLLETDTPYQVWIVVDYTLNYMEVFMQGGTGDYASQTSIGVAAFRVDPAAEQTVDYFAIGCSDGTLAEPKGVDYFLFDNVAIDTTGQNLATPSIAEPVTWAGYTVDGNGNANTGDWLGIINVTHAPWVYSWSMGAYLYIEEANVTDGGGWVYVSK